MSTCALVGAVDFNAGDFQARQAAGAFDFVIAVDAGFAHLEALGVEPDMAVGELRLARLRAEVPPRAPPSREEGQERHGGRPWNKAVMWEHEELMVYGALSGRLDHTLANLQLFAKFSERGLHVTGIGDGFAVRLLTGPDVFDLPEAALDAGTVWVFAANDVAKGVIEQGGWNTRWTTRRSRTAPRAAFRRAEPAGEQATIAVEEGTLYVFYPLG